MRRLLIICGLTLLPACSGHQQMHWPGEHGGMAEVHGPDAEVTIRIGKGGPCATSTPLARGPSAAPEAPASWHAAELVPEVAVHDFRWEPAPETTNTVEIKRLAEVCYVNPRGQAYHHAGCPFIDPGASAIPCSAAVEKWHRRACRTCGKGD